VRIHTLRRVVPAAAAAAALLLGATACGGGDDNVDKSALVGKLKTDSTFTPALNDTQAGCVADVVIKYIDHGALNSYIKDGKEIPDPKDSEKDKATSELQACIK
jgi:hypothetical protein